MLTRVVDALDRHVGQNSQRQPSWARIPVGSLSRRAYVKIRTGHTVYVSHEVTKSELTPTTIDTIKVRYGENTFDELFSVDKTSLADQVERIARTANHLFNVDATHVNLCFVLDSELRPLQLIRVDFEDHVDKFIFWSHLAHWISLRTEVAGIMFVGEMWLRKLDGFPYKPLSELKILGEGLWTVGLSKAGEYVSKQYEIIERDGKKASRGLARRGR